MSKARPAAPTSTPSGAVVYSIAPDGPKVWAWYTWPDHPEDRRRKLPLAPASHRGTAASEEAALEAIRAVAPPGAPLLRRPEAAKRLLAERDEAAFVREVRAAHRAAAAAGLPPPAPRYSPAGHLDADPEIVRLRDLEAQAWRSGVPQEEYVAVRAQIFARYADAATAAADAWFAAQGETPEAKSARHAANEAQARDRERALRAQIDALRNPGPPPAALAVLGLSAPTSVAEVKTAYRQLARTAHPDAGGDAADFRRLTEARDAALRALEPRAAE